MANQITFNELKQFFKETELPESIEDYPHLHLTVDLLIKQIDASLAKGNPSEHAKQQKEKLVFIFRELNGKDTV